jgi:hypothetical protein
MPAQVHDLCARFTKHKFSAGERVARGRPQ